MTRLLSGEWQTRTKRAFGLLGRYAGLEGLSTGTNLARGRWTVLMKSQWNWYQR
jgi:hypothetical protein